MSLNKKQSISIPWDWVSKKPLSTSGDRGRVGSESAHPDRNKSATQSRTGLPFPIDGKVTTIFQAPELSQFDVRLTTVLPQGGMGGTDIYLGRASGPMIDEIGGVPSGCSGSPVTVGGRVIGAISYLFLPDAKLVGVTPVGALLALKNEPGDVMASRSECAAHGAHLMLPAVGGFLFEQPLRRVERALRRRLTLMPGASIPLEHRFPMRGGSAVGIGLLTGDLRVGFIGTVAIVDDQDVFGFGHPALFMGPSRLPMTEAIIFETAHGDFPQKIGDLGSTIGTVLQDRSAGIYGRIGVSPATIPLTLTVTDEDRKVSKNINAEAADVASLLPSLIYSAASETMLRAMNRIGQGTASWRWKAILGGNDEAVIIEEIDFDPNDIGSAVAEAGESMIDDVLSRGVPIKEISLEARVTMARRTDVPTAEGH